ncbi:DUF1080 domain-containing protein [Rubripirellula sp.]|nr:family 16 glycoside hydrolase [Rubripirellula sp.]MDB4338698.1 DUF1080 domain-containing protein [Rubripirellula sp.]
MLRLACSIFLSGVFCFSAALAQVYTTVDEAKVDPDFELQGEYRDATRGVQAIALGDGGFSVVVYTGGLPGDGWNGKDKQVFEVDADGLESLVDQFDRVERKSPTLGASAPKGAVVLFDGSRQSLEDHWKPGAKMSDDGLLMQGCTSVDTFADYSMHLEFRLPYMPKARGQGRGNSGLYHQGRYETQILDSFGLEGRDNEAGGLYSIKAPDLNMCLPPLAWQTYDVDFAAAIFDAEGKKLQDAKITVRLNGVVVHREVTLPKSTTAAPVREGPENGPIYLQDHGNPVRFRNIWVSPRDLSAEMRRPVVPSFERFHSSGQDAIEGGRLLAGELNCIACHQASADVQEIVSVKQAPRLDRVGQRVKAEWMVDFIADPHGVKPGTTMPNLLALMPEAERKVAALALTNFLVGTDTVVSSTDRANAGTGERLFHESGCLACHAPQDNREHQATTSVPLVGLGDKYSRGSLEAFLKDPLAVRPSGRMPKIDLGGDNWRHVAQYLTGEDSIVFTTSRELPEKPNLNFKAYYLSVDQFPDLDERESDLSGVSRGLDIRVGKRDESVVLRFDGFLPIQNAGKYTFRLSSDDGSRLYLDGKEVINNDGVHPNTAKEGSVILNVGVHEFRVDYFEKSGQQELSLDWAGPGIKPGPIDKFLIMSRDGTPAPVESLEEPVDPEVFVYDPSLVPVGRELFSRLGCASCHDRQEKGQRIASALKAPALDACGTEAGCLAGIERSGIPQFDLTPVQSGALSQFVSSVQMKDSVAKLETEQLLVSEMTALNCYACHRRDGFGGAESERDSFFISSIPEMGDEGRLPPPLDGVGDKLREEWIQNVVANGNKSRPYMRTHMPGFGSEHGTRIAKLLQQLDQKTEAELTETKETENQKVTLGRKMVGAKGLGCVACHTYGKFKATGIQAIALDTMTSRIREDWFHRYLPNPSLYRPGTRMPSGYPEGKSTVTDIYGGDQNKQIAAMWAFLSKGDQGGVPEGITSGMIELKPDDRPVIYRNFIQGVSPRGIAVGYPEKLNICWDANNFSLSLIWQDRFIDASKHWVGRGQGNQTPLGGNPVSLEKTAAVAFLADEKAAWPSDAPRERGYRFLGYGLDERGRPTFRYKTPQATVEDKIIPISGDIAASLKREITITPNKDSGSAGLYFRAAVGQIEGNEQEGYLLEKTLKMSVSADGALPLLREIDGAKELLIPIKGATTIQQQIIW